MGTEGRPWLREEKGHREARPQPQAAGQPPIQPGPKGAQSPPLPRNFLSSPGVVSGEALGWGAGSGSRQHRCLLHRPPSGGPWPSAPRQAGPLAGNAVFGLPGKACLAPGSQALLVLITHHLHPHDSGRQSNDICRRGNLPARLSRKPLGPASSLGLRRPWPLLRDVSAAGAPRQRHAASLPSRTEAAAPETALSPGRATPPFPHF